MFLDKVMQGLSGKIMIMLFILVASSYQLEKNTTAESRNDNNPNNDIKERPIIINKIGEKIDPTTYLQKPIGEPIDLTHNREAPSKDETMSYELPTRSELIAETGDLQDIVLPFNKYCFKRGLTFAMMDNDTATGTTKFGCKGMPGTDLPNNTMCGAFYGDTYCFRKRPVLCINKQNINRPAYSFSEPESQNGWTGAVLRISPPVMGCSFKSQKHADNYCRKLYGCGFRMADYHDGRYMVGMNGTDYSNFTWNWGSTYKGYWAFWAFVVNHPMTMFRYWVTHNDVWGANPHCWPKKYYIKEFKAVMAQ